MTLSSGQDLLGGRCSVVLFFLYKLKRTASSRRRAERSYRAPWGRRSANNALRSAQHISSSEWCVVLYKQPKYTYSYLQLYTCSHPLIALLHAVVCGRVDSVRVNRPTACQKDALTTSRRRETFPAVLCDTLVSFVHRAGPADLSELVKGNLECLISHCTINSSISVVEHDPPPPPPHPC